MPESETTYAPTLRDMLMLDAPTDVRISPDGQRLAITVRTTNWRDNCYETHCLIHNLETGETAPLTRTGSVHQVEWVGNRTLAVLRREEGGDGNPQVWLFENLTGEGWQVTDHKTGVTWFKPFAGGIIFRASDPDREERKKRKERFGAVMHFEREPSASALYYTHFEAQRAYQAQAKAATEDEAKKLVDPVLELSRLLTEHLSIRKVAPSPTDDALYLTCWPHDDLVYYRNATSYRISLDAPAALGAYLQRKQAKEDGGAEADAASSAPCELQPADSDGAEADAASSASRELQPADSDSAEADAASSAPCELQPADSDSAEADAASSASRGLQSADSDEGEDEDTAYIGELVQLQMPANAQVVEISPDGAHLLVSYQGRDDKMYTRQDGWRIDVEQALAAPDPAAFVAALQPLTAPLDRTVLSYIWRDTGIYGAYVDGTVMCGLHITPAGELETLDFGDVYPAYDVDASDAGRLAFIGASATQPPEVWVAEWNAEGAPWDMRRVTDFGAAVEGWSLGAVETIHWESRDGTLIEGVLRKPADFDPEKRYPLVLVVHGGPSWFSSSYLLTGEDRSYYPAVQFVNKGMLVLKPNYRGSIGRGQAFQELNVNNLGVGDLWDIESGVEHLAALGWVDPDKVGCMGWSQGGYISAFAGLHSDAFQAVSVGAGISDWYTYHISNDIPDFTRDYLSASPFRDRAIYERTAPMRNITNAKTPMLIQHGSVDRRVPFSNAMELYRGLKEMGVPVELYVFPGMGHPITKPRENHAVMHQNLSWFSHYLLGEALELE